MSKIVYVLYKLSNWLYNIKIPLIPYLITIFIRIVFSGWIPYSAQIGKNCKFGKGAMGVVIHQKTVIGNNCIISHNVTFGGSSKKEKGLLPIVGNKVRIGSGAAILGNVKIGDNVIIGSNSVVRKDVSDNTIVAGNPAKILKENIIIEDYVDFR